MQIMEEYHWNRKVTCKVVDGEYAFQFERKNWNLKTRKVIGALKYN